MTCGSFISFLGGSDCGTGQWEKYEDVIAASARNKDVCAAAPHSFQNQEGCSTLREVMQDRVVTGEEGKKLTRLSAYHYEAINGAEHDIFSEALRGDYGKKALQARVRALRENVEEGWLFFGPSKGERLAAIRELATMGPDAMLALGSLSELAVGDEDREIRTAAAAAVEQVAGPVLAQIAGLQAYVKNTPNGLADRVDDLVERTEEGWLFFGSSKGERLDAIRQLGEMGGAAFAALPALAELMSCQNTSSPSAMIADEDIRQAATRAYVNIAGEALPSHRGLLELEYLDHPEQIALLEGLAALGPKAAPALDYLDRFIRQYDPQEERGGISGAFMGPSEQTQKVLAVHHAFSLIGRPALDYVVQKLADAKNPVLRGNYLQALGHIWELDPSKTIPLLIAHLDGDPSCPQHWGSKGYMAGSESNKDSGYDAAYGRAYEANCAWEYLRIIGEAARPYLLEALSSGNAAIRENAKRILESIDRENPSQKILS